MSIPKGYKMVPVEPNEEMINSGQDQEWTEDVYAAMLAAAPIPPQPIYDEAKERELFEASLGSTLASLNTKGDYLYVSSRDKWEGWKACAQSRAKAGEAGHE